MEGRAKDKKSINWINKAISRTIDLTCEVKHDGQFYEIQNLGSNVYRDFWRALLDWNVMSNKIPTFISFNYDLVLEKSLFQVLNGRTYQFGDPRLRSEAVSINYHLKNFPCFNYNFVHHTFTTNGSHEGIKLQPTNLPNNNHYKIDLLKLHGSLNFSKKKVQKSSTEINLVESLEDPLILPPIFNKLSNSKGLEPWKIALSKLRKAKNLCIVGYSLPKTDIYMQYFLKAAIGPNKNLNKIIIFDPLLFTDSQASQEMKDRYRSCFSPQLQNRIVFKPIGFDTSNANNKLGSFKHFTELLKKEPEHILF